MAQLTDKKKSQFERTRREAEDISDFEDDFSDKVNAATKQREGEVV